MKVGSSHMNRSGAMYHDRYSQAFNELKNSPQFHNLAGTIKNKCSLIRQAPYTACKSEPLKYKWARKRSGRINDRWRVIYKVCKECRRRGQQESNHMVKCLPCEGVPDDTVNFLDITDYHG